MTSVSVVIPTYNRADTVGRAVESALAQTQPNIEIIVVDDASTDSTRSVINLYDNECVNFIEHETNKGGSAARNTGIEHASGSYIAFLDSDDEWHQNKLKRQVNCLKQRDEEWKAAYCDFRTKRKGIFSTGIDRLFPRNSGREGGSELIKDLLLLKLSIGGSSTIIVSKEIINEINGFDESFSRHQDWEFLIRLLKCTQIAYTDEILVTKHHTGYAEYETAVRAKKQYLQKFSSEVIDLTWEGHPVIEKHLFMMAKVAFENNKIRTGLSFLYRSSIPSFRDVLGLIKAFCHGLVK